MASSYTHTTALKIYAAIAASGENGVDLEQLNHATGLKKNTLCTYGRWLLEDGAIELQLVHSNAANRPLKNLYFAVQEPRPKLTETERLKLIVEKLGPCRVKPEPKRSTIQSAIRDAILIALGKDCF